MKYFIFLLIATIFFLIGCVETYQEIRLKSDLSGEMHFCIVNHVDSSMAMMNSLQQMQSGKKTTLPDDEKKMMLDSMKAMFRVQAEEEKLKIESRLPEGIKISSFNIQEVNETTMEMKAVLVFDHIDKLKALQTLSAEEINTGEKKQSNPFEGFSIEQRQNGNIIIKQDLEVVSELKKMPGNATKKPKNKKEEEAMAQFEKALQPLIKSMGAHFRIRVPYVKYQVGKHNADEYDKKNQTLRWQYSSDRILKAYKQGKNLQSIYVELIPKK